MTTTSIVSSVVGVIFALIIIIAYLLAFYYQIKNKIMSKVNGAIDDAEASGEVGAEKKAAVVVQLQGLIPAVFKPFLTKERLEVIVQAAFDRIESYAEKQVAKEIKSREGDNG